ncbi:hypothetical protein [Streptomyces bauhiniae]|uniref:hypothetical protein n=1 Tax=Streptomyces bauhiniae TaxID=2340725 RepID=UPI0035D85A45
MQMNYHEPEAGGPEPITGLSAGEAVWECELPWQMAPLGETGQPVPFVAEETPHHGITACNAQAALADAEIVPAFTADTAFVPHRAPSEADSAAPGAGTPAHVGPRRRRGRTGSVALDAANERRARLRLVLAKPVLAGAGMLGAALLLAPTVFGEDAPAHKFQASAGDTDQDYASNQQYPDASDATAKDSGREGLPHRIAEVAAVSPTRSTHTTRNVEPMSQSYSPVPSKTPRPDSSPRPQHHQQQQPASQQWTSTVVNATSVLEPGQSWSTNRVTLAFQGDGNLVLYDTKGTPLWWSGTVGQGAKAIFQADGNFAVYTQDGATAWSSRTDGHNGAQLVIGADGNVSIRSGGAVLWSTGTAM